MLVFNIEERNCHYY